SEEVMSLVHKKVEAGQTEHVIQPEAEEEALAPSNIVDLTELLQRSLRKGGDKASDKGGEKAAAKPAHRAAKAKPASKRRAA
ncbi:MAG TPA: Ku protein, partial [Albitalea sp.]|nr:Ku protein [Albitalea sp.]